jgi:hypothetical protein
VLAVRRQVRKLVALSYSLHIAVDVGRMTVFNQFSRNEDLFFDRDEKVPDLLR